MRIDNRIKQTIRSGGVALGVFVTMPSPEIVELCALAGFDFVMLDGEHGRVSPDDAYAMVLAAEARDIDAMARVGQNDRQVVLKYLDLGVSGVMVPQTNTPQLATQAVSGMRYWPDGVRGLAGGRTFDYGTGRPMPELVPAINERVMTIVQFEHIDALPHLDELLQVPGLDMLFVGPTDLAQSMGYPGQPLHPEVEKVSEQVCAKARAAGVALGTVAGDAALANKRIDQGFQMILANASALILRAGRQMLDGIRTPSNA